MVLGVSTVSHYLVPLQSQVGTSRRGAVVPSGCSTVGSAPRSGRGGRKFESSHPDSSKRQES